MNGLFCSALVFLNFFPLWLVVLVRAGMSLADPSKCHGTEWCVIGGILAGIPLAYGYVANKLKKARQVPLSPDDAFSLRNIHERKTLTAEVLLTYVLPLWAFRFTEWTGVVEFLVFFLVVVGLTVRHMDMSGSLFLEWLGYRYYDCDVKYAGSGDAQTEGKRMMLLVKGTLSSAEGSPWCLRALNNQLMLAIKRCPIHEDEE